MPRPRLSRNVAETPKTTYFKPRGVPLSALGEAYLTVEGLGVLRRLRSGPGANDARELMGHLRRIL